MFILNGKKLRLDVPFVAGEGDDAIQYPANWLRLSSPEERTAIGITEVADASVNRPDADDRYNWITQNEDLTWTVIPRPVEQFIPSFVEEIDNTIAAIYKRFERFKSEYEDRYQSALAYKEAGYTGDQDESIAEWATNNNMLFNDAVDAVISQNAKTRAAVKPLGKLRMMKGRIKSAATIEEALQVRALILSQAEEINKLL